MHKTHIVYPLSDAKMRRLSDLFLEPDVAADDAAELRRRRRCQSVHHLRADPGACALPIPARRRAVLRHDVHPRPGVPRTGRRRRDRGSVLRHVSRSRPRSLGAISRLSRAGEGLPQLARRASEQPRARRVLGPVRYRATALSDAARTVLRSGDPQHRGPTLDFLWDGDGQNTNAQLTVFRHFNSATRRPRLRGRDPEDRVDHGFSDLRAHLLQLGRRLRRLRQRRTSGRDASLHGSPAHAVGEPVPDLPAGRPTPGDPGVVVRRRHPLAGLRIRQHAARACRTVRRFRFAAPTRSASCSRWWRRAILPSRDRRTFSTAAANHRAIALRPPSSSAARNARCSRSPTSADRGSPQLPEVAFLRIRAGTDTHGDAVYSLVHNRAHTNVAYMFGEENQLVPADDTLTVTRGTLGSYPNFVFEVEHRSDRIVHCSTARAAQRRRSGSAGGALGLAPYQSPFLVDDRLAARRLPPASAQRVRSVRPWSLRQPVMVG